MRCAVLALLALFAAAVPARAECRLDKLAEIPVTLVGLQPVVTVEVNGAPARLLVDTGSFFSTLSQAAADQLKVRTYVGDKLKVRGVDSDAETHIGVAHDFALGGVTAHNVEFVVGGAFSPAVVGVLGRNVLGSNDVEYDFAHGAIRFFRPVGCDQADLGYWAAGKANAVPLRWGPQRAPSLIGDAQVNGKPVTVLFDTGSGLSMLLREAASRVGVPLAGADVVPAGAARGIGGKTVQSWIAPVESFALGRETIRNTRLRLGAIDVLPADMLVGADFFLSHRVYVSAAQRRLYFTYGGGSVFRLDRAPAAPAPASPAAPAASPPG